MACSSRPGKKPLAGYAGAGWLSKIKSTPVFLAPVLDTATGDRSVVSAVRTPGKGIVAAFVALEPVGRSLVTLYGGGRPVEFLVTSADGRRIMTRSIEARRWIGAPLAGTAFGPGSDGVERHDLDGTNRLYEQAVVPGIGWHFYAGEDEAAALVAGNHLRERQLLIILAGLLLVALATLAVYRRVAVPIRRLGANVPQPRP